LIDRIDQVRLRAVVTVYQVSNEQIGEVMFLVEHAENLVSLNFQNGAIANSGCGHCSQGLIRGNASLDREIADRVQ